jgi:tubulin--tyrosine ligase
VKPGENTNCGSGIKVCCNIMEIRSAINNNLYNGHTCIVQRYIEKPLLFQKRKFDIRTYALVSSVNGFIKGYFYEDGYIRTSSKEYTLQNISSKLIHLTNDAV